VRRPEMDRLPIQSSMRDLDEKWVARSPTVTATTLSFFLSKTGAASPAQKRKQREVLSTKRIDLQIEAGAQKVAPASQGVLTTSLVTAPDRSQGPDLQ
jgi:hypothetical protein